MNLRLRLIVLAVTVASSPAVAACGDDSDSSERSQAIAALVAVANDACATGEFSPDWETINKDETLYGGWTLSNLTDRLGNNTFGPLVCSDPAGTVNSLLDVLVASGDFPKVPESTTG